MACCCGECVTETEGVGFVVIARHYYREWCTAHQVEDRSDSVIDTLAYVALMRNKNSGLPQESSRDYIFDEWDRYEFSQHF